ncbi:MAG: 4Fe-4S dicluster domain-containing protein [Dehalococcoidales bacterium]|nr:4Fe-4S dicluster domain-containing protein [Dehalococcoidales bacterium]
MTDTEQKLQAKARELLEQGKVEHIIGYAAGSLKFTTTPLITKDKDDTSRLVITPFIANNLSVFLNDFKGKVGIVAKPCDARSLISLIQDQQVVRENVVILGLPCQGLIDLRKVEKLTGKDRDDIEDIARDGDKVIVTAGGKKQEFTAKEAFYDDCLSCETQTPPEYDFLFGEAKPIPGDKEMSLRNIKELEKMAPQQRWEFWKQEFSKCIRCYACRQVCPACFCNRCFIEETEPEWLSPLPRWQDNLLFQTTRMLHVAGRCTDCGECERVCPVNIPLRSISKKVEEIVDELFQYKAGMDKNAQRLATAYEPTEAEDLMR